MKASSFIASVSWIARSPWNQSTFSKETSRNTFDHTCTDESITWKLMFKHSLSVTLSFKGLCGHESDSFNKVGRTYFEWQWNSNLYEDILCNASWESSCLEEHDSSPDDQIIQIQRLRMVKTRGSVSSAIKIKVQFGFLPEYQFGWEAHQWLNYNSARVDLPKPIWSLKKIKINVLLSKINLYSVCLIIHNLCNWKSALKRAGPCQRDFKGRSLQPDAIRKTSKSLLCTTQGTT